MTFIDLHLPSALLSGGSAERKDTKGISSKSENPARRKYSAEGRPYALARPDYAEEAD
jgi:hypothetical protein